MLAGVIISVFLTGVSLSMDAFAVSICDGMVYRNLNKKNGLVIPLTFGIFQALMPIIGFYVGLLFLELIDAFDHWIAFALLLIIGGKMIFDGIKELRAGEKEIAPKRFSFTEVLVQGVATSVDALAVGFSLPAILQGVSDIQLGAWLSVCAVGIITFTISLAGVYIGVKVGKLFRKRASAAEIVGGVVLIGIGIKILIEGLI